MNRDLLDLALGGLFVMTALLVMGIVVPFAVKQLVLVSLHNLRDRIYRLGLEEHPWLLDLKVYRLGETLVTGAIFSCRYGGYFESLQLSAIIALSRHRAHRAHTLSPLSRAITDELDSTIGNDGRRRRVVAEFMELVLQTEQPLVWRVAFGHYIALPFGLVFFAINLLHRLIHLISRKTDDTDETREVLVSTALGARNVARIPRRPKTAMEEPEPEPVGIA